MKKEKLIYHASIILCGFINMLEGTLTAAMICASIWLFVSAAFDYGYFAILCFLLGILALGGAIVLMRKMGKRIYCKTGKYS